MYSRDNHVYTKLEVFSFSMDGLLKVGIGSGLERIWKGKGARGF